MLCENIGLMTEIYAYQTFPEATPASWEELLGRHAPEWTGKEHAEHISGSACALITFSSPGRKNPHVCAKAASPFAPESARNACATLSNKNVLDGDRKNLYLLLSMRAIPP